MYLKRPDEGAEPGAAPAPRERTRASALRWYAARRTGDRAWRSCGTGSPAAKREVAPGPDFDAVEESSLRSLDQAIADALVKRDVVDRLAGGTADAVSGNLALVRTRIYAFKDMATARGLELHDASGDLVEYSALDHELIGGARLGVRRVRVVQPQVRAREASGRFRVVRKALVEAASSS